MLANDQHTPLLSVCITCLKCSDVSSNFGHSKKRYIQNLELGISEFDWVIAKLVLILAHQSAQIREISFGQLFFIKFANR